ncbi:very short patch repair endonuclease [Lachnospiraceae bacterium 38-10]
MDIVTPEQRSKNMSAIRSSGTKPEVYLRKLLFAQGYRYSLNSAKVPGHPDIYLKKHNTVIFVHGCFWHRHRGCKYAYMPKSRVDFWQKKFDANVRRDQVVKGELESRNIRHLIVWECAIRQACKKGNSSDRLISVVTDFIYSNKKYDEISADIFLQKE